MNKQLNCRIEFWAVILAIFLSGCNEELPILAPGNPVPVVYSFVNPADTIHYIKLGRSFCGNETFSKMARDSSLLFFANPQVALEIVTDIGWPVKYASFSKSIGPEKEPGVFLESPNLLYKFNGQLQTYLADGYTMRLIISIPDEKIYCSASQIYYAPPELLLPTASHHTMKMNLYYGEPIQIKWEDKYGYSAYQIAIIFNYQDFYDNDSLFTSAKVLFNHDGHVSSPDQKTSTLIQILHGDTFLRLLGKSIEDNVNVLYRKFQSFDIVLTAASPSYRDYRDSYNIASDRLGRPVSNVADGLGLFALISETKHEGYLLDKPSIDSLCSGRFTKQLGFVKW